MVEDDPNFALTLGEVLEASGFHVLIAHDVTEGHQQLRQNHIDAVIVDLMLPDGFGIELCRASKASSHRPVVAISGLGESHHASAISSGADAFFTKPFRPRELTAVLHDRIRRNSQEADIEVGAVHLDVRRREVALGGKRLGLTPREFELLHFLLSHRGEALESSRILREVWGWKSDDLADRRTLYVHMASLRQKLEPAAPRVRLETLHRFGYRLDAEPPPSRS